MPLSCIPKSVLSSNNCVENPAGLSNHLFAIPVSELTIAANEETNQYDITPTGGGALQGYRIDFKAQTGQVTSEDNGTAKGWSCTGTGRVEMNENDMAHTSRILHNSDQYLYFFATGKKVAGDGGVMQSEYLVIGNENGEAEWAVASDTGVSRTDDHGQTFTVTCAYQLYPMTKWYGVIEQADAE